MPHLVLLGRRSPVAGDDLRLYAILSILFRLTQIALAGVVLSKHACNAEARPRREVVLWVYGALSMAIALIHACIDAVMYVVQEINQLSSFSHTPLRRYQTSKRGTPTQPDERKLLQPLCFVKLVPMSMARFANVILGGWLYRNSCLFWIKGLLAMQTADLAMALLIIAMLHCDRKGWRKQLGVSETTAWQMWFRCCCACMSVLTCCALGGIEAARADFADISVALAEFFDTEEVDVTISDIMAALAVIHRDQRALRLKARDELLKLLESRDDEEEGLESQSSLRNLNLVQDDDGEMVFETDERHLLDPGDEQDCRVIQEGLHYLSLAQAIYGVLLYEVNHPMDTCCVFTTALQHCCASQFVGDNMCRGNRAALIREAEAGGFDSESILFASFITGVIATPYCVVVDQKFKAIVVSIRGTLSLEDAVTDLTIKPTKLSDVWKPPHCTGRGTVLMKGSIPERWEDGVAMDPVPADSVESDIFCHSGMLRTADWILQDLKRRKLLNLAFQRHPSFDLVVTGHSMGAGCAAILAMMLRPEYPSVHAFCFSPPGCVFSQGVEQEYVTSFVLGTDIVPRLSLSSVHHLRDTILDTIARMNVPKHCVYKAPGSERIQPNAITKPSDETIHSEFQQRLDRFHKEKEGTSTHQSGARLSTWLTRYSLQPNVESLSLVSRSTCFHRRVSCCCSTRLLKWCDGHSRWCRLDQSSPRTLPSGQSTMTLRRSRLPRRSSMITTRLRYGRR